MAESWRSVVGWEHRYEVSNKGRIRSITRVINRHYRNGNVVKVLRKGKELALDVTQSPADRVPRVRVDLHIKDASHPEGYSRSYNVANLVLEAFVGPAPKSTKVAFRNGNHLDVTLKNLSWKPTKKWTLETRIEGLTQEVKRLTALLDDAGIEY